MTLLLENSMASQFDRLPPQAIETEMCVIASMMLCGEDRETFDLTRSMLRRDWFFHADHQVLFDVICQLSDAGKPIDAMIVREELKRQQLLDEIGGTEYLASILGSVPSYTHGPAYAETIREKAMLRSMISLSNDMLRASYAPMRGVGAVGEISRDFFNRLADLTAESASARFVRLGGATLERMNRKRGGEELLVPTGIPSLDDVQNGIGGIPIGKFTLVGGRPGSGKSLLCKQLALNASKLNIPVGIVTIEETSDKVAENMLSNLSGVENKTIAFGNPDEFQWREIERAQEEIDPLPFWIDDKPTKLAEVEEAVTTAAVRHKCKLIVVDYLQLIDPGEKGDSENREITIISQSLKRLAKRLGIALIAACQLNRGNESSGIRKPALRDLRGSGTLEQDGDLIILLHREDYYHAAEPGYQFNGQVEAIVAKFKNGSPGVIPLKFSGKTQSISEWVSSDPFPPLTITKVKSTHPPFDPFTGQDL